MILNKKEVVEKYDSWDQNDLGDFYLDFCDLTFMTMFNKLLKKHSEV